MNRRIALKLSGLSFLGLVAGARLAFAEAFEITKTDAEWQKILTDVQFATLRQEVTESPFTSTLLDEHRNGKFNCAGCELPIYTSA